MARRLAIEGETVAAVADALHAAGEAMPAQRRGRDRRRRRQVAAIDRVQRVLREDVLDVHEQQLLVLLLVLQAQLDAARDLPRVLGRRRGEQFAHGPVDMRAEGHHLGHPGSRDQPPPRAGEGRAVGFVVGVEQVVVERFRRAVAGQEGLEDEGLEEPGDMRQVPFRRADVGHALDHMVLGAERGADRLAGRAYALVALRQRLPGMGIFLFRYRACEMAHGASPLRDAVIASIWNRHGGISKVAIGMRRRPVGGASAVRRVDGDFPSTIPEP
ncbi:hypothetical protein D3C76_1085860 [compost metagenome]